MDQLRVLVSIDDSGSFSAAGRQLRRVQSAISHTVQALEEAQGVQLFDRSTRTPRMTAAGQALVEQARQVLRQAAVFERTASAEAPWYVVPANSKWYARLAVQELLISALEDIDPQWPVADFDVEAEKKRLAAS